MASEDRSTNQHATIHMHKGWLAALAALIVLFLVFMFGIAAGRFSYGGFGGRTHGFIGGAMVGHERRLGRMMADGAVTDSQDRVIGTVTAVNGSDLTVAAGGSSYTVQTSSSTQWQNGNTAKVNDTVVAYGTTNNGVLTATQVVINP